MKDMTINKYIYISIILFFLSFQNNLIADGSIGTSGADFLEIGTGSRPLSMGEAFTAAIGDIHSIYYNPAGLATMKYPVLSIMHQDLIWDSRFENISLSMPLLNGFFGISNSVFWVPPFERIDIDGMEVGTVQFYNTSSTFAYGQSLGFMEVGGSMKYIYQRIHSLKLHSLAFDAGVLKRMYMFSPFDAPIRNFSLGFSILNIGTKAKNDDLPRIIRFGASYYLTNWLNFNIDLTESIINSSDLYDFTYGFDESFRIKTGIEFTYMNILSLRSGYRFNDAGSYSFGMGFNYVIKNVSFIIDASYSDSGTVFGPVYSLNISFKLIPKIITIDDRRRANEHYKNGIKHYIANDIDSAIDEFKKSRDYDPYFKNIKQKIKELEELKELQEKLEELGE